MAFSSRALLNLQRLSRAVKKELQVTVSISTREGIGELLRRTALESHSIAIIEAQNVFVSDLSEQGREELASYDVPLESGSTSTSVIRSPELSNNSKEKQNKAISYDRRQRNVHIDHERRKTPVVYRGTVINADRRQQDLPYLGPDRRGRSIDEGNSSGEKVGTKSEVEPKKKKSQRMYRGQPIDDD